MITHVRLLPVVPVELRENAADVVDDELRQLPIMILNNEAEEFSMLIMHYVANFLFERERR